MRRPPFQSSSPNPPRRRHLAWWGLVAGCLPLGLLAADAPPTSAAADAIETPVPPPLGRAYEDFQLINDRNIFNPHRTARSRYAGTEAEAPRAPEIEVVALSGILGYTRGTFAFFDSASGEFRKALRAGEEIAGYRLKEIAPAHVLLERGGETLTLKVGQQLRRVDAGPWTVTQDAVVTAASPTSSRSGAGERGPGRPGAQEDRPAATVSGAGPSEALKRLLEQRRKEQGP